MILRGHPKTSPRRSRNTVSPSQSHPSIEAGKPTSLNLGICKQSRKIEQAVDFLMFLSSKSSMERWIVDRDRIAPVRNIEPNPLVKAFAPHEEGHLRGFRVDFLNYVIDLTGSAFKSNLHLLINPKGQEDRRGDHAIFTQKLKAISC